MDIVFVHLALLFLNRLKLDELNLLSVSGGRECSCKMKVEQFLYSCVIVSYIE
jgi:hypothetical protein